MLRRRTAPLALVALSLALTLGAFAEDEPAGPDPDASSATSSPSEPESESASEPASETPSESASETPEASGTRIEIERTGDAITPNGERVEVAAGEPVVLVITSDTAGELHVHSTPEQEVAYDAGTSEHELTIDRPGVVEVESHEPALVVLQLEVR